VERNAPTVVAELAERFAAYERALVERDLEALGTFFASDDDVVRYGVADRQRGAAELAAYRASQGPLPPGRELSETTILTFGADVGVVATLFSYPDRPSLGRQSQTWVKRDGAWKIVHAHVSEIP
jgi:hypothetical protein